MFTRLRRCKDPRWSAYMEAMNKLKLEQQAKDRALGCALPTPAATPPDNRASGGMIDPRGAQAVQPASNAPTVKKRTRSTERGEGRSDDRAANRLLNVFTKGLADERFDRAASVLKDDALTANDKLTKIDTLIRLPAGLASGPSNLGSWLA